MTVYIEYAIIDNFVIDYLLLNCTLIIFDKKTERYRIILTALLGTMVAIVYPLLRLPSVVLIMFKIACGMVLCVAVCSYSSLKEYLLFNVIFLSATFLTGGGVSGIYGLLGINSQEFCVGFAVIPAYVVIKSILFIINKITKIKAESGYKRNVRIFYKNKSLSLVGLIDSGNNLYYLGKPVCVISKINALKIMDVKDLLSLKKTEISTVSGKDKLYVFTLEKMEVEVNKKIQRYENVYVCVSKSVGLNTGIILHPNLKESYVEKIKTEIREVS